VEGAGVFGEKVAKEVFDEEGFQLRENGLLNNILEWFYQKWGFVEMN
jgi:hypothetical protein